MSAAKGLMAAYAAADVGAGNRGLARLATSTYSSSIAAAAASASSNSGRDRTNPAVCPNSEKPSQESLLNLLKRLDRDPHKALRFLGSVTAPHGLKPNAATYNLVSSILGGEGNPVRNFWVRARTTALALGRKGFPIREVMGSRDGREMSVDTYLRLSSQLRGSRMVKRAARLNGFVMNTPCLPKM